MKTINKKFLLLLIVCFFTFQVWSIDTYLSKGLDGYSKGAFSQSIIYFQKSLDATGGKNEEAQYWLTLALTSSKNYSQALIEAKRFLAVYPDSLKTPDILYQSGRLEVANGNYETAISTLYDFIEKYPKDKAVASAYFWIAESLYNTSRFDEARTIFSVIILDYPESAKVEAAKYKLALIDQAATQAELLRLLKLSNEETLRLSSDLEKLQAKITTQNTIENRNINDDISNRIKELESNLIEERKKNTELYDKLTILQMKNEELSSMIANFAKQAYEQDEKLAETTTETEIPIEPTETPKETTIDEVALPATPVEPTEAEIKRNATLEELLRKADVLKNMYNEVLETQN